MAFTGLPVTSFGLPADHTYMYGPVIADEWRAVGLLPLL